MAKRRQTRHSDSSLLVATHDISGNAALKVGSPVDLFVYDSVISTSSFAKEQSLPSHAPLSEDPKQKVGLEASNPMHLSIDSTSGRWHSAEISKVRTEMDKASGNMIVVSYDVVYVGEDEEDGREAATTSSKRGKRRRYRRTSSIGDTSLSLFSRSEGEAGVEPKRLRVRIRPATSAKKAPKRERLTRGYSQSVENLPGTTVYQDLGDDGLFRGTVLREVSDVPGYFEVQMHDGEIDELQWFKIVKLQQERPAIYHDDMDMKGVEQTLRTGDWRSFQGYNSRSFAYGLAGGGYQLQSTLYARDGLQGSVEDRLSSAAGYNYRWRAQQHSTESDPKALPKKSKRPTRKRSVRVALDKDECPPPLPAALAAAGPVHIVRCRQDDTPVTTTAAATEEVKETAMSPTSDGTLWYVCKNNETVTSVAARLGMIAGDIIAWNSLRLGRGLNRKAKLKELTPLRLPPTYNLDAQSLLGHAIPIVDEIAVLQQDAPCSEPVSEVNWVQCDACGKWRILPQEVVLAGDDDESWYCHMNQWSDPLRNTCAAPEDTVTAPVALRTDIEEPSHSTIPIDTKVSNPKSSLLSPCYDRRDGSSQSAALESSLVAATEIHHGFPSLPITSKGESDTRQRTPDGVSPSADDTVVPKSAHDEPQEMETCQASPQTATEAAIRRDSSSEILYTEEQRVEQSDSATELAVDTGPKLPIKGASNEVAGSTQTCDFVVKEDHCEETKSASEMKEAAAAPVDESEEEKENESDIAAEFKEGEPKVGDSVWYDRLAQTMAESEAEPARTVKFNAELVQPREASEDNFACIESGEAEDTEEWVEATVESIQGEYFDLKVVVDGSDVIVKGVHKSDMQPVEYEDEDEESEDEDDEEEEDDYPRPDLVITFGLFDSGGKHFAYYRICALRNVASFVDYADSVDRKIRFVAHVDHLVDDATLLELHSAARGRLTAVRYSMSQPNSSKTCWLISAMRYRVLWETDTDETVVSVDIHDDSEMQQRQIERLERKLHASEEKQIAFTYWRAAGSCCENESAVPVRVQGGAHAHTDGGMLVWTAGDARVQVRTAAAAFHCPDQPCAEVSGSVQSKGRGFDFASFVEQQMQSCSHNQIRGCDEMLLDAFLKGHLDPTQVLWQPHAHSIRSLKNNTRSSRKSSKGEWDESERSHFVEVGWRHLDIGDGQGLLLLCCPEQQKRKKTTRKDIGQIAHAQASAANETERGDGRKRKTKSSMHGKKTQKLIAASAAVAKRNQKKRRKKTDEKKSR